MNKKTTIFASELFKDKTVPPFISEHRLFRKPVGNEEPYIVRKVFRSIGLSNFQDKVNIDKCLTDVKKEGSYVYSLLRVMSDMATNAHDTACHKADALQYIEMDRSVREKERSKMLELYHLSRILTTIAYLTEPTSKDVIDNAIQTNENKITLTLLRDIPNPAEPSKNLFRKGEALFRIYGKLRDRCEAVGVSFQPLDGIEAFKTFCKENIPNKEYSVIFSADGHEGAWDLLTMSMRSDWHSCQRWDGEYPKCLIGSILSKFVGILYLTSGVMSSGHEKNGNRSSLGTKMMRRCIVRYAIDADENKPCIMIDKMYPDFDKSIMDAFMKTITSRTSLPVYYAPDVGTTNRIRHIYVPTEDITTNILEREKSYQDTPLKAKHDLNVYIINSNKDEVERELKGFKVNLSIFLARKFEEVYCGGMADPEIKKSLNNIRMNTSFTPFCDGVSNFIMSAFRAPQSGSFSHSKAYYKRYLMEFLMKRSQTMASCKANLLALISQNTSRVIDTNAFVQYLTSLTNQFIKSEIRRISN